MKGHVKAPPQTPQSPTSSNPPTSEDARPYVLIYGKRVEVPEVYPKGAEGRLFKSSNSSSRRISVMLVRGTTIRVQSQSHQTRRLL